MEIKLNVKISKKELATLAKVIRKERKERKANNSQRGREFRHYHQVVHKTATEKKYDELKMLERKIAALRKELQK